jgi:hypothetical protein|tara:strand:- start:1229 stop:1870 length:642 start_codon:yes stop_codon:yes gene_type:complete
MSTLRTITDFKTALQGGGARANLFEVDIPTIPAVATQGIDWDAENFQFLCKAAALPASNVAPIEVPFRGRTLKVAGDRTFDTWTVTVINDEDFKLRSAFEQWMNGISKLDNNTGATNPSSYMARAIVHQLGRGADQGRFSQTNSDIAGGSGVTPLRTYLFNDVFPTNVSQIDLSYDSADTIEEYTVEFQVQYWTAGSAQASGGATDQSGVALT